jgi:hypothetical protein
MPQIQTSPILDKMAYDVKAAPAPAAKPEPTPAKPVYGPPAPKDELEIPQARKGASESEYPFLEHAEEFEKPADGDQLLDKLRDGVGDEVFFSAAGAAVGGALAAGKRVKLKMDVEDQVNLPNARLELGVALKENRQAREMRSNGTDAILNLQQGAKKPRGAGVQLTFTSNF